MLRGSTPFVAVRKVILVLLQVTEEEQVVQTIDTAAQAIAGTPEGAASFLQVATANGQARPAFPARLPQQHPHSDT